MSNMYVAVVVVAVLSLLTAAAALLLFFINHRADPSITSSRLLWIVMMLIFSDGCVAVCVLVWHYFQKSEGNSDELSRVCRVFLPFPIYFFLAGFGWTMMVAMRFLQVSERRRLYEPSLWWVWVVSFVIVAPIIVMSSLYFEGYDVSRVITTSYSGELEHSYCVFNSKTPEGVWTNNICFQLPLLVTIAANVYAFSRGLVALRSAPQSVVAREMNRAGKYLFVLLLVWIPNFFANIVQESEGGFGVQNDEGGDDNRMDTDVSYYVDFMVFMTSMQGLLNVLIYALGHKTFRKYLHQLMKKCCCSDDDDNTEISSSLLRNYTRELTNGASSSSYLNNDNVYNFGISASGDNNYARSESEDRHREKFSRLGSPEKSVRFAPN